MVVNVMTKTEATVRAWVKMYKAVVKMVLLYKSESWVVTEVTLKVLEGFQHWVAQHIAGISAWGVGERGWEWSLVEEALEVMGLGPMREYICRRQNTVVKYNVNHPIYEMCTGADWMCGA